MTTMDEQYGLKLFGLRILFIENGKRHFISVDKHAFAKVNKLQTCSRHSCKQINRHRHSRPPFVSPIEPYKSRNFRNKHTLRL